MGLFNKKELRRIAELEDENSELRGKNSSLSKEREQLQAKTIELSNTIESLSRFKSVDDLAQEIERLKAEYEGLKDTYTRARETYSKLLEDISRTEDELSTLKEEQLFAIEYGVYAPHFDFDTSEEYKIKISSIRQEQKEQIKSGSAVVGGNGITWNGSAAKGKEMVDRFKKLMLRAFNGECDSMISSVDWNNIDRYEKRMVSSRDSIGALFSDYQGLNISIEYLNLKVKELHLAYEYKLKKHEEKEEQRRIREEMREQEKAEREIEAAKIKAQKEEDMYLKALEKARADIATAQGAKQQKLLDRIAELEAGLANAETLKLKAMSMAQQTKMGYVYVISNIGAFGENVYKIGMTRRLEPMDRVRELGDASVPFPFDVHAIIFSQDAPNMEYRLHQVFDSERLNMINCRREFFKVPLSKIKEEAEKLGARVEFTMLAEAREYRESERIRKEGSLSIQHKTDELLSKVLDVYPEEI